MHLEITGETSPPQERGECGGEGYEAIKITMNGKEAAKVVMTLCRESQSTITTVLGTGVSYELLHCATLFSAYSDLAKNMKETTCSGGKINKSGEVEN